MTSTGATLPVVSANPGSVEGHQTLSKPAALVLSGADGLILLGGRNIGIDTEVNFVIKSLATPGSDPWIGFEISIPRAPIDTLENEGFGVSHWPDPLKNTCKPVSAQDRRLRVKFPRHGVDVDVYEASSEVKNLFPNRDVRSIAEFKLREGSSVFVEGWALPFHNPNNNSWVNDNGPWIGDYSLLDVLQQRHFFFASRLFANFLNASLDLSRLPPPLTLPFGPDLLDKTGFIQVADANKGQQFPPTWVFPSDDVHVSYLIYSEILDELWLARAADEIRRISFRAHFIKDESCLEPSNSRFFAVLPTPNEFVGKFRAVWQRSLVGFKLHIFRNREDNQPVQWKAAFVEHAQTVLPDRSFAPNEMVILVDRSDAEFPLAIFENRDDADAAFEYNANKWNLVALNFDSEMRDSFRKAEAALAFLPSALPTNPRTFGLSDDNMDPAVLKSRLKFRMALHRDLMRGGGFWSSLREKAMDDMNESMSSLQLENGGRSTSLPSLPVENYLEGATSEFIDALLQEVLPEDRRRLRGYLSARTLGLSLVTGGPGFGKTTTLCLFIVALLRRYGHVLCVTVNEAALDILASRLDEVFARVLERHNAAAAQSFPPPLFVRPLPMQEELATLLELLKNPRTMDEPEVTTPNLSLAYWFLVVFQSRHVYVTKEPSSVKEIRRTLSTMPVTAKLRALVAGTLSWDEYEKTATQGNEFETVFRVILQNAQCLACTPAQACQGDLKMWKNTRARAIAVDEAGSMTRADLLSVWGNTLLPCVLAGDDTQSAPMKSLLEKDADDFFVNRLALNGRISPLLFLKASGWPVYRLRRQLRMARGLFDICHKGIYANVPLEYGSESDIDLPRHAPGRALETFMKGKFPDLESETGLLLPICVHVQGTKCLKDRVTSAFRNEEMVRKALDLLVELVEGSSVNASHLVAVSPYKADVALINEIVESEPEYAALSTMPATNSDSFHGREGDIVCVFLTACTGYGSPVLKDNDQMSLLLSRPRSGLLIFGDIEVSFMRESKAKKRNRMAADMFKDGFLAGVKKSLWQSGRGVSLSVESGGDVEDDEQLDL
ncbi:hypothetical protein CDD80_3360 [Ophiocordyceps camponoti-rufipedis]|uniref:DNA2/NAM7 helicase-like C-terminal domain-containing protein n=1 Tax=Ophiocordyceps camponoti-rufipedis TaxID=2004952 RepID=A0A2C5YSK0_9HYPO|nr:hypothetical protein CDD80_3360 [Ophiocordyceps camponoti-rufipedis]